MGGRAKKKGEEKVGKKIEGEGEILLNAGSLV